MWLDLGIHYNDDNDDDGGFWNKHGTAMTCLSLQILNLKIKYAYHYRMG